MCFFFACIIFQIDLVDDIPNQDDEDMDDVTIIEPVSKTKSVSVEREEFLAVSRVIYSFCSIFSGKNTQDSMPTTTQKSANTAASVATNLVEQLDVAEPMDSISITAISSSSNANGSTHQTQEPVPEVTISPAPGSNSTITSTTTLLAMVEQARAAAI